MPLRPATFAPYPAPDKRAAARERYLRALEEARKAKEAYADTLSDGEEAKKETETEQLDHPSPPTTTETANSNTTRREEPMTVDPVDPLPATRADSPLAQTEPLLRQPSPAIPAAAPVSESAPAPVPPTPAAAASKAGCDGSHKACHLTSWLRASIGIPSMFAAFPKTASPVDPHPQRIETTMPAPIPGPPPTTTPAAAPAPSDNDCAHRRRAALNVATLSEQQPPADFKSTSSFARTDSSASSSSRLDTRQRRPDDGFRVTDDHRSQPSPSSSSSSHHGFPPAAATAASSSSSARDGWLPRASGGGAGGDLYRRPEFPPTQLAPLPPPRRSRSDSTSDDGSGSVSGSGSGAGAGTGTVLPPLRETSGWRYGQPSQFTDKYVWDERRPPSSPSSGERQQQQQQQQQLPPMSRGSSSSSRSHLPLLAAAAATVEANSMYRGSDSAPCLKRHERDWDSDRDQEDSRRSRDRPWESGCLVAKGVDGHKREVGEHLFSAAYPSSSSRRSDGSSPRRIPREPAAPHGLADLPRAFAALTSGSPLATAAAPPTSIKYPLDFMRPGRGESVMPEPVQSDERVMPSPIDNDDDDDGGGDVPMREAGRGRSRSRSRSPASTLTASSSVPPLRVAPAAAAGRNGKGKEPATTPKLPGLAGLAPLPPLARALPQLPLPAPKPRPPSPTPQRIPLFVCEESSGASACVAAAEEPDAASADALSEIGRLSTSLESLKHAFTFPSADQLDFGPAVWPAGFSRTTSTETEGPRVRLPVTARNLTVHAYEHALHKLLGRLDGVGAARVRGVREARKRVVGSVREELARLDDHVQGAARAWLARNPDVSLP